MNLIDSIILKISSKGKFARRYYLPIWMVIDTVVALLNHFFIKSDLISYTIMFSGTLYILVTLRLIQTGGWWWTHEEDEDY